MIEQTSNTLLYISKRHKNYANSFKIYVVKQNILWNTILFKKRSLP